MSVVREDRDLLVRLGQLANEAAAVAPEASSELAVRLAETLGWASDGDQAERWCLPGDRLIELGHDLHRRSVRIAVNGEGAP